ncbi:MAG: hypothetical protein IKA30_00665, partial [Alphaproteobacteria bacterium]|nr:hypothetical protein [Alphaproteobacteria bacterium]
KTARLNNENPQEKAFVSLSEAHFSHCHKEHAKFVLHKMTEKLGQAMKWSGKQASDVLIGLAASPVFAAYKLLDKKYHYEESSFSRILDKEIAPRLKKALLTAAITTATTLGLKNSEKVSQFVEGVKTEIADAKQDKQLSKKYKITDEQSFANLYNASLEHIVKSLSLSEIYSPKAYSDNGKTINTIGLGSYYYPQDGNPQSSKWIRVSTYVNNNGSISVDGQKAVQLVDGWFKNRDGGRIYKNMQKVLMGAELNICEFSAIATCYYNSETAGKKFAEFVCENYDNPDTCASKLMSLTPQNEFKSGIDKRHLHEALKYLNYDDYNKKIDDMIVEKRKKSNGNTFYVTSITQLKDTDCLKFKVALKNNDHEALSRITDKICSYKGKGNGVSIKSIYYDNNMDEAVSELSNHKVKTIKWNLAVNLASNLNNTH